MHRSIVRPGASVLEIGSGAGDPLAAVEPARGVGVDVSPGMVELARARHPGLRFEVAAGEDFALDETYDYIVLSDLVPYVDDLLALFQNVAAHSTATPGSSSTPTASSGGRSSRCWSCSG